MKLKIKTKISKILVEVVLPEVSVLVAEAVGLLSVEVVSVPKLEDGIITGTRSLSWTITPLMVSVSTPPISVETSTLPSSISVSLQKKGKTIL